MHKYGNLIEGKNMICQDLHLNSQAKRAIPPVSCKFTVIQIINWEFRAQDFVRKIKLEDPQIIPQRRNKNKHN